MITGSLFKLVFLIIAVILCLLAGINVPSSRANLLALGVAALAASFLFP